MSDRARLLVLWLISGTVAAFFAMNLLPAAFVDGEFIPVSNDSFYHARRVLDAAAGNFYQFDPRIHVQEGSWLVWPWAYDYLLGLFIAVVTAVAPGVDQMKLLAYVPVLWVYVNLGLLLGVGVTLGLGAAPLALAMACAAASPLIQLLHGVGMIDHHYIELTWVLLAALLGLRWLQAPEAIVRAVALGIALGAAPAFHTALFVLQLPLLGALFLLWLRGRQLPLIVAVRFVTALLATTVLVLAPSGPLWDGQFHFYTLSWFHLYAAIATGAVVVFLSWRPFSAATLTLLAALAFVLAGPLLWQMVTAAEFLGGGVVRLDAIGEVASPLRMATGPGGFAKVMGLYSGLIWIAPVLLVAAAWRLWKERDAASVYFAAFAGFGLGLLLIQYRLHYFGSFLLFLAPALIASKASERFPDASRGVMLVAVLLTALAYIPPFKTQLFARHVPAIDPYYAISREIYARLAEACEREPGVVLADSNDGHYIRYHTECSVIANNFLLTPQHERKIAELDGLMALRPAELTVEAPHVHYIFARFEDLYLQAPDGSMTPSTVAQLKRRNPRLIRDLLLGSTPPGFALLHELRLDDGRDIPYARLLKVTE
jgi:hypothetical protein